MRIVALRRVALGLLVVALCSACEREDWKPEMLAKTSRHPDTTVLETGREVYGNYCAGCHGVEGDGAGPAARFLDPKPRDFRLGIIKFAAVESGQLPYNEDYVRIIRSGLHGTSMPAWRFLPETDLRAAVEYIKTFAADQFAEDQPHPRIIPTMDPWRGREEKAIPEGAMIYHALARCNNCHPSYLTHQEIYDVSKAKFGYGIKDFRENEHQGVVSTNDWGEEVRAPDFLDATIKSGTDPEALYRVITSGVGGTAMPTWLGSLPEENLWALVHYIKSLTELRGTDGAAALRTKLETQPKLDVPASPPPAPADNEDLEDYYSEGAS